MDAAKQKVNYRPEAGSFIEIGMHAHVFAVGHRTRPDGRVTTSRVQSYDFTTGIFETRNTVYSPEPT